MKRKTFMVVLMALLMATGAGTLFADNVKWSWSTEYPQVDSFRYSFDNEEWTEIDGSLRSLILRDVAPGTTMYLQQSVDGLIWSETAWATWNGEDVEGEILFALPDAPDMVIRQYTRVSEISDAVNRADQVVAEGADDFARVVVSDGVLCHAGGEPIHDLDGNPITVGEGGTLLYADGTAVTDLEGNRLHVLENGRLMREDGTLATVEDVIGEGVDEERLVPLSKAIYSGSEIDDSEPVRMAAGVRDGVFVDVNGEPVLDAKGQKVPAYVFPNGRVADQYGNLVTDKDGNPLTVGEGGLLVDQNGERTAMYPVYDETGAATVSVWEDGQAPSQEDEAAAGGDFEAVGVYIGGFVSYQDPGAANWMVGGSDVKLAYGVDLRLSLFEWVEVASQLSFFNFDILSSFAGVSSTAYIGPRIPIRTSVGELSVSLGVGVGHSWIVDRAGDEYTVNRGCMDEMWGNSHLLYRLAFGWDFDQFDVPLAFQVFWATGARDSFSEMGQDFGAMSLVPEFGHSSVGIALDLKF